MDDVRTEGPLFDGRAEAAMDRAVHQIRENIAKQGKEMAAAYFAGSIRRDRGVFLGSFRTVSDTTTFTSRSGRKIYEMTIEADPATDTIVTTDIASYGPWLEGVGSRNDVTRFKGYHGFRLTAQELDRKAEEIGNHTMDEGFIQEMNV